MVQAYKAVGESTEIPLTYYENNVSATIKLLQVMNEFDCTRIVYSSSATVYGTPPHIPIPESTRIQAESPYGKTKVMCETIIEDLCAGASDCPEAMTRSSRPHFHTAEPSRWRAISLRYFKYVAFFCFAPSPRNPRFLDLHRPLRCFTTLTLTFAQN